MSVLVPGLEGPATRAEAGAAEAAAALVAGLALPGFTALLSGAALARSTLPGATLADLGAAALCLPGAGEGALPAGALTRLAPPDEALPDAGDPRVWLRADPVHLRPDMGKLIVFPPQVLSLTLDESSRLADWLQAQPLFPGPPLSLITAQAWVCPAEPAPGMTSVSPQAAYGEDAREVIARGGDAARWHGRMNEIQMLLHECPVNEARERDGHAPVNSLWFWGEGATPPASASPPVFDTVRTDDPVIQGAARLAGVPVSPTGGGLREEPWNATGGAHHLVAVPDLELPARAQDLEGWRAAMEDLDSAWLAPLARALHAGRLSAVDLYLAGTAVRARRPRAWLRWRRPASAVDSLARLRQEAAR